MAMRLIINALSELGIFAIGATAVGLIAKNLISNYFDKEVSKYQNELDKELTAYQSNLDKEIEQHRAELERQLDQYRSELEKEKLKFSELHNERAKVTANLYEKFINFERDMRTLTDLMDRKNDPSKSEQMENAAISGNDFVEYYQKNKIYFPPHVCDTIEELRDELKDVYIDFQVYKPHIDEPEDPVDAQKWMDGWNIVANNEVQEIKADLEGHFRQLLGVEVEEQIKSE